MEKSGRWRLKAAPTAAGACGRRAPARSLRSRARAWRLRHHACLRRLPAPAPGTRTDPIIGRASGLGGPQILSPRVDAPGIRARWDSYIALLYHTLSRNPGERCGMITGKPPAQLHRRRRAVFARRAATRTMPMQPEALMPVLALPPVGKTPTRHLHPAVGPGMSSPRTARRDSIHA